MKAFFKFTLTSIGLLLILLGVGALLVLTQAQSYLSRATGDVLSDTFGSDAEVESVSFDPADRALVLENFVLKNPEGFKEGEAFTCEKVHVVFGPKTFISRHPVIELIDLEGAHVYYRYELGQGTNIGAIAKRLPETDPEGPVQYTVEKLRCEDAKMHLSSNLLPGASLPVNMVTIEMTDLNEGEPLSPSKVTSLFLLSVLKEAVTLKGLVASAYDSLRKDIDGLEK